ncbi:MAG: hypothetical protein H7301_11745 [Cryobacterium sp.]|nr:hypothetical protein [Oligoflexia bacterium]
MKLVEFLILVLAAHAETLKRLAAFFGEEAFVEILEESDDENAPPRKSNHPRGTLPRWMEDPGSEPNAYALLEGTVRDFDLPAVLQFHLWAYPPYRAFIESSVNLNAKLTPGDDAGKALVENACADAEEWVKSLPMPSVVTVAAYKAAAVPWLRFRTETLKRLGRRPLGSV